jgi:hypothetical protein
VGQSRKYFQLQHEQGKLQQSLVSGIISEEARVIGAGYKPLSTIDYRCEDRKIQPLPKTLINLFLSLFFLSRVHFHSSSNKRKKWFLSLDESGESKASSMGHAGKSHNERRDGDPLSRST